MKYFENIKDNMESGSAYKPQLDINFGELISFINSLQEVRGHQCVCRAHHKEARYGICFDHHETEGHYEFVFGGPDAFELCRLLFQVGVGLPGVTITYGQVSPQSYNHLGDQAIWMFAQRYAQWDPETEMVYEW